jgi:hypothetical protein
MPRPPWYQSIGKYAYSDLSKSLWQLVDTFVPYGLLWTLMLYTAVQFSSFEAWNLLKILTGGKYHGTDQSCQPLDLANQRLASPKLFYRESVDKKEKTHG